LGVSLFFVLFWLIHLVLGQNGLGLKCTYMDVLLT
jgi:hypothetical protein